MSIFLGKYFLVRSNRMDDGWLYLDDAMQTLSMPTRLGPPYVPKFEPVALPSACRGFVADALAGRCVGNVAGLNATLQALMGAFGLSYFRTTGPGLLEIRVTRQVANAYDYSKSDLTNADLSDVQFTNASLAGAVLTNVKFQRCVFRGCRFDGCPMQRADLTGAELMAHTLDGLDLTDVNFQSVRMTGTSLRNCVLTRTRFSGAAAASTSFTGSTVKDAVFDSAILDGADFSGVTLTDGTSARGASFKQARFTGGALRGVKLNKGIHLEGASFSGATLESVSLDESWLQNTDFGGATLKNVDFTNAVLDDATFAGPRPALLSNVEFNGAQVHRTNFSGVGFDAGKGRLAQARRGASEATRTNLTRAGLDLAALGSDWSWLNCSDATIGGLANASITATGAILDGVVFSDQTLTGDFVNCSFRGASFSNCNLEDSKFRSGTALCGSADGRLAADFGGAVLRNVDFDSADLTSVSFGGADLWGAKFTRATMALTNFANAFVPEANFTAIKDKQMAGVDFGNAFLVSASFRETTMLARDGKAPNFTGACLLGTDFTGGSLTEAVLTNAKLSSAAGTIDATLTPRPSGGPPPTASFDYEPTKLPSSITGPHTRCPAGGTGPCSAQQLTTPVPAEWRQP